MTLTIGSTDITPYIALGGVKWQRNDVDGPAAGRTITGTMERDRVATKMRMDVTCIIMDATTLNTIMALIQPEYITVSYSDPMIGTRSNVVMYSNNNSCVYSHKDIHGVEMWKEITFPLIEV